MTTSLSCQLSPSPCMKMTDEEFSITKIVGNKQGIVSILGSECEPTKVAASLRRTLSADMSSKKWLEQQGFPPMKKNQSFGNLFPSLSSISDSSSDEEETGDEKNPCQLDIWTLILSQKEQDSKSAKVDPYIHPLVKISSSLSEKSLQICTESLGSETGSDGFSSEPPPPPLPEALEVDKKEIQEQDKVEELVIPKYGKKLPTRSFPPPLPSLVRGDGPSLRMQSHRKNGRLVVEAVSVPTQNYFSAQRQDGRLLLTFLNTSNLENQPKTNQENVVENDFEEDVRIWSNDEEFGEYESEEEEEDDENEEDEGEYKKEEMVEEIKEVAKREVINVHSSPILMNKFIRLANSNSTWPKRINEVIKLRYEEEDEEEEVDQTHMLKSLPIATRILPRLVSPSSTAAATFNVYENCWRNKNSSTIFTTIPLQKQPPQKNMFIFSKTSGTNTTTTTFRAIDHDKKQLVRGGEEGENLMPMNKGCKEPRRSLVFWGPHCIATS